MRIVGGQHKGYRFHPPKKTPARPTTDIAKEGLFNTLNNYINFDEEKYLDLFGGTGSISYEMASRGCTDITLVERDNSNCKFIQEMAAKLALPIKVLQQDVFKYMNQCQEKYDLIFAGPPYPLKTLDTIPDLVFKHQLLDTKGWLVLEHNPNHNFDDHERLRLKKNYGSTIFSIFEQ